MQVHLGFLTNNAGDDIPGSTIKWTLETFYKYFDSCIVVDGRLTNEATDFYKTIPNIKVIDSPWRGQHVLQYIERTKAVPDGDYVLLLDCDEAPTFELAENIRRVVDYAKQKDVSILSPPAYNMWCKHNSNNFYKTSWFDPENPPLGHKQILVKVSPDLKYHSNKTGTHVTPYCLDNSKKIVLPFGHFHFKSPETTIFNGAICIMDDLFPGSGEPPDGGIRGLTLEEVYTLNSIGTKYDLLSKEKFRLATKNRSWPDELKEFVKRFKHREGHCRMLYTLYYVILKAAEDTDPLTYEDACTIGTLNDNYKLSESREQPLVVPHTPVLLEDPTSTCGAG